MLLFYKTILLSVSLFFRGIASGTMSDTVRPLFLLYVAYSTLWVVVFFNKPECSKGDQLKSHDEKNEGIALWSFVYVVRFFSAWIILLRLR